MDEPIQLGKYTLKRKLAMGGMAEIWLAEQHGPGGFAKELVIKRILPHLATDEKFVEMFLDEARLAAQLHHPNIVQIYDLGEVDGSYFIAMEYIKGHDLEQILSFALAGGSPVDPPMAARIMADACAALDYAHNFVDGEGRRVNLVHRDVSPQNILVSDQGVVKLVDFGVAKAATSQHKTQTGAVKGKFAYMSPEQISGHPLDGRSDLFAVGIVLFELLTGRRPFGHENELMAVTAIMHHPAPKPSESNARVTKGLDQIVLRALEKDPGQRFPSAEAMQTALEQYLRDSKRLIGTKDLRDYVAHLFGEVPAASGPITGAGALLPPPGGPSPDTVNLHLRHTQPIDPTHQAATARVAPARSRGLGAGLVFALILVFVALGGGGYFLYTTLTKPHEGTGTLASGADSGRGPVAVDQPDAGTAPSAADAGTIVASAPDVGATAQPDAGGGPPVEVDLGAGVATAADAGPIAPTEADLGTPLALIPDAAPLAVIPDAAPLAVVPDAAPLAVVPDAAPLAVVPDAAPLALIPDAGPAGGDMGGLAMSPDAGPAGPDLGGPVAVLADAGTTVTAADAGPAAPDLGGPVALVTPDAGQTAATTDAGSPPVADAGAVALAGDAGPGQAATDAGPSVAAADAGGVSLPDAAVAQNDAATPPPTPDVGPSQEEPTQVAQENPGEEPGNDDGSHHQAHGPGIIRVRIQPPGRYEILIDGAVVGRTPLPDQEVPAGSHEVMVRRVGQEEGTTQRVRVRAGRPSTVRFDFR